MQGPSVIDIDWSENVLRLGSFICSHPSDFRSLSYKQIILFLFLPLQSDFFSSTHISYVYEALLYFRDDHFGFINVDWLCIIVIGSIPSSVWAIFHVEHRNFRNNQNYRFQEASEKPGAQNSIRTELNVSLADRWEDCSIHKFNSTRDKKIDQDTVPVIITRITRCREV